MASPVLLAAMAAFRAFASPAALAQFTSTAAALAVAHAAAARTNSEYRVRELLRSGMGFSQASF
jgi:hypothetical protein